jgi:hypothetical protein
MIKIIYENSNVLKGTDAYEEIDCTLGISGISIDSEDDYDHEKYDTTLEKFKGINLIGIYGNSHSFESSEK